MGAVLFVGESAAARAPLAEALARHAWPGADVRSAGRRASHVHPEVHRVLGEIGVDGHGLRSRDLFDVDLEDLELVVVLAPEAAAAAPPAPRRLDWWVPDPVSAPREELREAFRAARDELLRRIRSTRPPR